jgi:hypothetical protein
MTVRRLQRRRRGVGRLVMAVAALLPLALMPAAFADSRTTTPLRATFSGDFVVTFSDTGPPVLRFSGHGTGTHLGRASVEGGAVFGEEVSPGCFRLEDDEVILTAADGSELFLVNEAVDCVNPPHVSATGTYTVVGGTGRFDGASGEGTVSTAALITGELPDDSGFTGTFDPLRFDGLISR